MAKGGERHWTCENQLGKSWCDGFEHVCEGVYTACTYGGTRFFEGPFEPAECG